MLQMNNVSKVYQTEMVQTHALRDFNLQVNEGEFIAVTGPSGSGKTTFLNIAGMLEPFNEGEYLLDGVNVGSLNDNQRADLRNQKIGFIFQSFNLIGFKTAIENVALPLYYQKVSRKERNATAMEYLKKVGLEDWALHLPNQMSGGQKQRVAIARALVTKPKVILADEPTGALDSTTSREVMTLLREINKEGITMIIVTHEHDIAALCDRTILLTDGLIV